MFVGFGEKKEKEARQVQGFKEDRLLFTRWGWSGALASMSFPKVLLK
jgi:hypothetical protein